MQAPLAQSPKVVGDRRALGRSNTVDALFPAPPPKVELPPGYAKVLGELKKRIEQTRLATVIAANTEMVRLYWQVGHVILARQEEEGWGAKVIDRLSYDLRRAFPDMGGLSARNLKYMRAFASTWTDREIVQAPLAQLTWYHHLALIEKLDDKAVRLWYATRAVEHGWSRNILAFQIAGRLHARQGKALNNFKRTLPPTDSDFAAQVFKDPYLFGFLGTADPRQEHEIEASLVAHVERFLLELGSGFAFVGRQVPLEVRLRAWCEGFSLHAGVVIAAHDRDALERLCRYGARPAFALERLAWTDDGRISYKLKRAWPDGRTHLVMEPVAFLRLLLGIIPPPRRHLVRYSGVFGPASKHRTKLRALVPTDIDAPPKAACGGGSGTENPRLLRLLQDLVTNEGCDARVPTNTSRTSCVAARRRRAAGCATTSGTAVPT